MARNHTLNLILKKYTPADKPQKIYIQYRGEFKTIKNSKLNILPSHWDRKNRKIKDQFISDNLKLQKELDNLEKKMRECLIELQNGNITPHTALDSIIKKPLEGVSLTEFIERWIGIEEGQKIKYSRFINAIQGSLKGVKDMPNELTVSDLNDVTFCEKLSDLIKKTVKGNDYFAMLDRITRKAKLPNQNPFLNNKLRNKGVSNKRKKKKAKREFDDKQFTMAINKINTPLHLASYLWYLYSFSLQGLDGIDLVNLDEDSLEGSNKKEINHYHPEGSAINPVRNFGVKHHLVIDREKSGETVEALYNVFPVLFIRNWLHYLIGICYPQYVYEGKDRIRLFNFKTVKPNGDKDNKVINGEWKQLRDIFRKYQVNLFGTSTKHARTTFVKYCEKIGLDKFKIQRMLGHSVDGAINHYLGTPEVTERNINQMQVIEEFGVIKKLFFLYEAFEDKTYLGEQFVKIDKEFFIGLTLLEGGKGKLSSWSSKQEKRYQVLLSEIENGESVFDKKDGKVVYKSIEKKDYPPELKELEKERKKVSDRTPKWVKPPTKEIIKHNKKIIKELEIIEHNKKMAKELEKKGIISNIDR